MEDKFFGFLKVSLIVIVAIVLLLTFTLIGYTLGYRGAANEAYQLGYSTAWEKARTAVEKAGIFPRMDKITSLRGEVIKVEGNKIYFKAQNVDPNPLNPQGPEERIARVTDETEIIKRVSKTTEEFNKEVEEFKQKRAELQEKAEKGEEVNMTLTPPFPYKEVNITLKEIKSGDKIRVYSNDDIRLAKEFEVTKIYITE